MRSRDGPPEIDSLPDLIRADSHFRKDIIRDLQGVIPGIVLGQSVFLCLGLTHSHSYTLRIVVFAIREGL